MLSRMNEGAGGLRAGRAQVAALRGVALTPPLKKQTGVCPYVGEEHSAGGSQKKNQMYSQSGKSCSI